MVPLNTRLAAHDYAYVLAHSGATLVFAGSEFRQPLGDALAELGAGRAPAVVWVDHEESSRCEYEALLAAAAPAPLDRPAGRARAPLDQLHVRDDRAPEGRDDTRTAAPTCTALGVVAEAGLTPRGAYLWTLPMFHCNGWAFTWAVTAAGATHVCLPRVDPELIWAALLEERVTHLCAAPTVVR